MHQASVGFHCPECAKSGAQKVVRAGELRSGRLRHPRSCVAVNVAIFVAGIGGGLETRDRVIFDGGLVGSAKPVHQELMAWPTASGTGSSPPASSTPT